MTAPVNAEGICIAFDNDTHEMGQTWERIDEPNASYVISCSTSRGRPSEFETTEAGTGQLVLQNRTGAFDATNPSGPFYGRLRPLLQTKLNFQHPITGDYVNPDTGKAYDILHGYIEDFLHNRQGPRGAQTEVPLSDGFELLNQAHGSPGKDGTFYAAQHIEARMLAQLGDASWDADFARIATGNVNLQSGVYDAGTSILEMLQADARAEFPNVANLFMDKSGYAAFSGRGIRFDPTSYPEWITRWRVGDAASCALDPSLLPVFDIETVLGKDALYNDVICAPAGADLLHIKNNNVRDLVSIGLNGRRSLSLLDLIILDGSTSGNSGIDECHDFATYFAGNYATAQERVSLIEFHGQMDDGTTTPGGYSGGLWDFILNVELNHIVEVHTVHPGGGGLDGVDFFVEGIHNDVSRLNDKIPRWTMNLDLSPRATRFAHYP